VQAHCQTRGWEDSLGELERKGGAEAQNPAPERKKLPGLWGPGASQGRKKNAPTWDGSIPTAGASRQPSSAPDGDRRGVD
jgi:hypothetical protein